MNTKFVEAREHLTRAREALRRGDKESARQLGEKAALLVPEMEDAWLILAAADSNPDDALAYARKALELNPQSERAHRGVEWASGRLKQAHPEQSVVLNTSKGQRAPEPLRMIRSEAVFVSPLIKPVYQEANPLVKTESNKRILVFAGLFGLLACAVVGFAAWSAVTSPVFASIINSAPTQENLWAQVEVAKPVVAPLDVSVFADPEVTVTATPSSVDEPTALPVDAPTRAPTDRPTSAPTSSAPTEEPLPATPEITETPGTLAMEIIQDTPTSEYIPLPTSSAPKPSVASSGNGSRWIDVDLTNQRVYAYEGDTVVNSFIVSTGTWQTPTVTGQYNIYVKYRSAKMSGPGYYLPDVPYIMYFYKGYGLHGTYWHNNFGTPMSHGCVNLTIDDAGWLYNWASVGTLVNVHY